MMIDPTSEQTPSDETEFPGAPAGQGGETAGGPDPFAVVESLNAENAALKDKMLRVMADMENLRRRTEREIADSKVYGISNFAREMLNVADNLHRALASVPSEAKAAASEAMKSLFQGVELTEKDLISRLARFNVKPIEPEGKKFDPNMHEALFEIPDESVAAGTVMQVVEKGYAIGERVLRPAKVGVSRGGPKSIN
jgi:molecular chaperone GrpE